MVNSVPSRSRVSRPRNKSPVEAPDASGDASSKSRYYDERSYRERERESGRGRGESERDRDRREESHRSRH